MSTDIARRGFLWGAAALGAAPGPTHAPRLFDIRDFGAVSDRKTNCAAHIQAAIDACTAAGGGTVYIPPGEYLSGTFALKSHVSLYLEAGATIYASLIKSDYPTGAHLVTAKNAEYISVLGPGILHGQATGDLGRRPGTAYEPRPAFRIGVMLLTGCRDVTLRDFSILYSDSWACHLSLCQRVVVDGITIFNNYFHTNSDGIDPESCRDVRISNCHITAGDDCICLKTRDGIPCEDIVVTNCTTESVATAIKLGTGSFGDYRNITISNCTVRNSTVGVGFFIKDGGIIERVAISNLTIETLRDPMLVNAERLRNMIYPIFLDIEKRTDASKIGAIRDVVFSGIQITSDNGILVQGMPESIIENLTLRDISFRLTRGFDYSHRERHAGGTSNPKDDRITIYARQPSYCTIANVRNLMVDNLTLLGPNPVLEQYHRSALAVLHAENVVARSVFRTDAPKAGPVISLSDVRKALVTDCLTPVSQLVDEKNCEGIRVQASS